MPRKRRARSGRGKDQEEQAAHGSQEVPTAFSLLDHSALPLLLQHTSLLDQQTICRLLCVSRGMSAGVLLHCTGLLTASISLPRYGPDGEDDVSTEQAWQAVQQFAGWLSHNATLVQHFQNNGVDPEGKQAEAAEAAIAAALKAAAAKAPLQIESYTAACVSSATHLILEQLPAAKLTCLELVFSIEAEKATLPRGFSRTLAALTGLKRLALECGGDSMIVAGMSQLGQLTYLEIRPVVNVTKLRYVPPQLQELVFSTEKPRNFLQLSHVTALTRLAAIDCFGRHGAYTITDKDQLPTNLVELDVRDAESARPLLHLQQLKKLILHNTVLPAGQLEQLSSSLSSLQDVRLQYVNRFDSDGSLVQAPESAAAGWAGLPMKTLVIRSKAEEAGYDLSGHLVQGLSALTGLTCLEIVGPEVFEASAQQLGAALAALTALQTLRLGGDDMFDSIVYENGDGDSDIFPDYESEDRAMKTVLEGCMGSSSLRELSISDWYLRGEAIDCLKQATNLKALELEGCFLTDETVLSLASSITGLRVLNISGNKRVTSAVLDNLVIQLKKLQRLCIYDTGVSVEEADAFSSQHRTLSIFKDLPLLEMHHELQLAG